MAYAEAKHLLQCSHHLGGNVRVYHMRCDLLAVMPSGKVKVRVYGRMYWKGTETIERIRYVDAFRVAASAASP